MASGLKSDKDSVMKAVQKLNNNIEKVLNYLSYFCGKNKYWLVKRYETINLFWKKNEYCLENEGGGGNILKIHFRVI